MYNNKYIHFDGYVMGYYNLPELFPIDKTTVRIVTMSNKFTVQNIKLSVGIAMFSSGVSLPSTGRFWSFGIVGLFRAKFPELLW